LKIKTGSSLTFKTFFNQVCSSIKNEEKIVELRRKKEKLIKITEKLEKYLEEKIEFILKKYKSKLGKV